MQCSVCCGTGTLVQRDGCGGSRVAPCSADTCCDGADPPAPSPPWLSVGAWSKAQGDVSITIAGLTSRVWIWKFGGHRPARELGALRVDPARMGTEFQNSRDKKFSVGLHPITPLQLLGVPHRGYSRSVRLAVSFSGVWVWMGLCRVWACAGMRHRSTHPAHHAARASGGLVCLSDVGRARGQ
jgi:hypothetical protein